MQFAFHPDAESEYMESVAFYEGSQQGFGLRFVEAFEDALKRILESPRTW